MPNDITPLTSDAVDHLGASPGQPVSLSRRQKAAIVVRLLLAEGVSLPLSDLPASLQAELISQMAGMRFVDRVTLRAVAEEFAGELDSVGLAFPEGIKGALDLLDGALGPEVVARLRRQSNAVWDDDPWAAIAALPISRLEPLLTREEPEVAAVILSKLPVPLAAELLSRLKGVEARRLALAVSETAKVRPAAVSRIGVALAAELEAEPPREFPAEAVQRLGAILDITPAVTREDLLNGLEEEDAELAERVRAAIFTFADIPERVRARDVPLLIREVDTEDLIASGRSGDARIEAAMDFLFENMPQRMAESLREETSQRPKPDAADQDAAHRSVIETIRSLSDSGTIKLISPINGNNSD